jgi:dihydroxyacetone kinase-like protein
MYAEAARLLDARGVEVARSLVGSYVTSLDMSGCSLTVVRLDDELTQLWDAPVRTPALTW